MAFSSMTGYGRFAVRIAEKELVWEIRSLNHRHLDISLRMPDTFRFLEMKVRRLCRQKIQRGKIDIFLNFSDAATKGEVTIDWARLDKLVALYRNMCDRYQLSATPEPIALLTWMNTLETRSTDWSTQEAPLLSAFESALDTLVEVRQAEGVFLQQDFSEKLTKMREIVQTLANDMPQFFASLQEKTKAMLQQFGVSSDPERLEQEIALLAMKYDVAEEITRLQAHIARMHTWLETKGPVGRQVEFLVQEMHREANTLGNKGYHQSMTEQAMQLKILIEQLREQSANVE